MHERRGGRARACLETTDRVESIRVVFVAKHRLSSALEHTHSPNFCFLPETGKLAIYLMEHVDLIGAVFNM